MLQLLLGSDLLLLLLESLVEVVGGGGGHLPVREVRGGREGDNCRDRVVHHHGGVWGGAGVVARRCGLGEGGHVGGVVPHSASSEGHGEAWLCGERGGGRGGVWGGVVGYSITGGGPMVVDVGREVVDVNVFGIWYRDALDVASHRRGGGGGGERGVG